MTNAKKLLALLLAVLTFVSVAVIGVHAEEAKTETTTGETTTEKPTEKPTLSPAAKALEALFIKGATGKVVSGKIEITADAKTAEITVADTDKVDIVSEDAALKLVDDKFSVAFVDAHKVEINENGEYGKGTNKVVGKVTVDGIGEFDITFDFVGEDANGHRYNKKIGEAVKPTHDEFGYTIYECNCGAQARKDKVDKLPGKVTKVNCGPDLSVAKEGTIKIEPKVDTLGDPKYTVTYKSSDEKIATVSEKGVVTGIATGKATITCTVTFTEAGKTVTVTDTVNVKVTYTLIQWILVAVEAIVTGSVFVWDLILDALGLMK